MSQLLHGIYVWPALATTTSLAVDPTEGPLTLSLQISSTSSETRAQDSSSPASATLQCWTDLLESNTSTWHAINVSEWPPVNAQQAIISQLTIPSRLVKDIAKTRKPAEFSFTWRLVHTGKDEHVTWLGNPGQDCRIRLVPLPSKKTIPIPYDDQEALAGLLQYPPDVELKRYDDSQIGPYSNLSSVELSMTANNVRRPLLTPKIRLRSGLVVERTKSCWHTSRAIRSTEELSSELLASLLVLQFDSLPKGCVHGSEISTLVILVPLCTDVSTVKVARATSDLEEIDIVVENTSEDHDNLRAQVLVATGSVRDLHSLLRRIFQAVESIIGRPREANNALTEASRVSPLSSLQGLGFCTWEALGNGTPAHLSAVMTTIEAFESNFEEDCITSLLIDDGWQHISEANVYTPQDKNRTLVSFDLAPQLLDIQDEVVNGSTSSGQSDCSRLATYILQLRRKFPHIRHYGVWMTLAGYWDGLHAAPDGIFSQRYGPLVRATFSGTRESTDPSGSCCLPAVEHLDDFWRDAFQAYKQAGVDFVKVDAQARWDRITSIDIGEERTSAPLSPLQYHDVAWNAMNTAAEHIFGPQCLIHCMALGSRFHYSPVVSAKKGGQLHFRNSDDTFPNIPDAHRWHIYHNAMNAFMTSSVPRIVPDADMFTSFMPAGQGRESPDWASYHAAFRTIFSSSKIWISDSLGISRRKKTRAVLNSLLAPEKGDQSGVGRLMTVQVGLTSAGVVSLPLSTCALSDCVGFGPGLPLFLTSRWSMDRVTLGILSAWNVRGGASIAHGWITISDVAECLDLAMPVKPLQYCVASMWSHSIAFVMSEEVLRQQSLSPISSRPLLPTRLEEGGWDAFSISPAYQLSLGISVSCLGLVDKYAGLACVETFDMATVPRRSSDGPKSNEIENSEEARQMLPSPCSLLRLPYRVDTLRLALVLLINTMSHLALASFTFVLSFLRPFESKRDVDNNTTSSALSFLLQPLHLVARMAYEGLSSGYLHTFRSACLDILHPSLPIRQSSKEAINLDLIDARVQIIKKSWGVFPTFTLKIVTSDLNAKLRVDGPRHCSSVRRREDKEEESVISVRLNRAGECTFAFSTEGARWRRVEEVITVYVDQVKVDWENHIRIKEHNGFQLVTLDMISFLQDERSLLQVPSHEIDGNSWQIILSYSESFQ